MSADQKNKQDKNFDQEEFRESIKDEAIPHIYFNGFSNGLGNGDVTVVCKRNGDAVATLNMSFTVAKTLSQKLNNMISGLESTSGNKILSTDDIDQLDFS